MFFFKKNVSYAVKSVPLSRVTILRTTLVAVVGNHAAAVNERQNDGIVPRILRFIWNYLDSPVVAARTLNTVLSSQNYRSYKDESF